MNMRTGRNSSRVAAIGETKRADTNSISVKTKFNHRQCVNTIRELHVTHYTQHITHYTQHITHYTQHTTLHTQHTTLHTLHTTHYTLHITHFTLHITHYTQHTTQHKLHTTVLNKKIKFIYIQNQKLYERLYKNTISHKRTTYL